MIKSKCMARGGVLITLVLLLSLFTSCNQNNNKPKVKSSNANVIFISVDTQTFDLDKSDEVQEFYVDEEKEESELLSKIVVVFEDAGGKKEIVGENENVFETKPHEEKTYTINTFAEDGTQGKSYKVKLIRFIIDKTIEVKAPVAPFKSGLNITFKPDYMALGNGRTIDFDTFRIAKYEVTYKLWKEVYDFATKNGYKFTWEAPTSDVKKEDLLKPIVNLNWADALIWCNAYSEYKNSHDLDFSPLYVKRGTEEVLKDATDFPTLTSSVDILLNKQGVRLPTEVEWEVAGRGGDYTKPEWSYNFAGTNEEANLGDYAWFGGNASGKFHRVGEKKPNSIGLHDMTGNAGEFCYDFIDFVKPFKQEGIVINPIGFRQGNVPSRGEKGGNIRKEAKFLKLANRNTSILTLQIEDNGFRFVEAMNTRPFTYEEEPAECDVVEIVVGSVTYTKANLATLDGAKLTVTSDSVAIKVTYTGASDKANLKINDGDAISFANNIATTTVSTKKKTNSVKLVVNDFGKMSKSWEFTIENSNGGGNPPPPPPPPPPTPGT
ncbi:MAG: formylglycine-generating enzyme family protein [Treponema sp.]